MAKMITRTFKENIVEFTVVDITSGEIRNEQVSVGKIPNDDEDNEKLLKNIRAIYETKDVRVISINSVNVKETLRGMTEEMFYENSKEMKDEMEKRKTYKNNRNEKEAEQ